MGSTDVVVVGSLSDIPLMEFGGISRVTVTPEEEGSIPPGATVKCR